MLAMKRRQAGLTLIELMIGLVLGLVVSGIALSMYISTLGITGQTVDTVRLNQELRAAMELMSTDIRRAGYWGGTDVANNPHSSVVSGGLHIGVFDSPSSALPSSCVIMTYDFDDDGSAATEHIFGYKLVDVDGLPSHIAVLEEVGASGASNVNCSYSPVSGAWETLTDTRSTQINNLEFVINAGSVASWAVLSSKSIDINLEGEVISDDRIVRELREAVRVRNEF